MAKKFVFASGKGGVGKTSMAVGIGKALASLGNSVLIVDFDNLRSLDLIVGVAEYVVYDWGDVLFSRCSLNDAIYNAGDISIISCPKKYGATTEQEIGELIRSLDSSFDYIICDAPAGVGRGMVLACACADKGIIVSTPDYVCVRSGFAAADTMRELGVEDIRLIVNRAVKKDIKRKKLLNIDSVIDSTQVQLVGVVPEDPKIRLGAMGVSIYQKSQTSFSAITSIARRFTGENVPLSFG